MDENNEARDLIEQSARAGDLRQLSYGRGDWADSLAESTELTQAELGLLHSQVPGHRWNGWCRLTGDEDYYAACSCGWRSTDTGNVSPMLGQVRDHLDAVRQSRGGSRSARARDESGSDAGRGEIVYLHERARELCATAAGEQIRLSRSAGHSADLLSASAEQADRLVTELERGEWARTTVSASGAETVRHKVQRAKELRKVIVAAAAALAVMTEEIARIHADLTEAKPSSGKAHDM